MQKQRNQPTVWAVEFYSFIYEESTGERLLPQQQAITKRRSARIAIRSANDPTGDSESVGSANTYDVSEEDANEDDDLDDADNEMWPHWTLEGDLHKGGVVAIRDHPHSHSHSPTHSQSKHEGAEQRYHPEHSHLPHHHHHHQQHTHGHKTAAAPQDELNDEDNEVEVDHDAEEEEALRGDELTQLVERKKLLHRRTHAHSNTYK